MMLCSGVQRSAVNALVCGGRGRKWRNREIFSGVEMVMLSSEDLPSPESSKQLQNFPFFCTTSQSVAAITSKNGLENAESNTFFHTPHPTVI